MIQTVVWAMLCVIGVAAGEPGREDAQRDDEIFGSAAQTEQEAEIRDAVRSDAQRDAEIFGAADETSEDAETSDGPETAEDTPASIPQRRREVQMFGGPPVRGYPQMGQGGMDRFGLEATFAKALGAAEDLLTLGGFMFLRSEYDVKEDTSLNWRQYPFRSPNLMDFYFDARPSDRLRSYMRGRLMYNPGIAAGALDPITLAPVQEISLALDQFWIKFDVARLAYVTLGRQPVRWGAGRFWNPTDFLAQYHRDSLAIFDQRVGVTLLKVHVPWEAEGWNFYAFADLTRADTLGNVGGALRTEAAWGQSEISISVAKHAQGPTQLGFDASTGVGWFDLRLEAATQHGVTQPFFDMSGGFMRQVSHADTWFVQALLGIDFSIPYGNNDSVVLGAEYFYNQLGYADKAMYPAAFQALRSQGVAIPYLYLGRQYGALFAFFDKPGGWNTSSVTLTALSNFSDESWLVRLDYQLRALTYMDVNVYGVYHFGTRGGELHFGSAEFNIPTARAEVGIGLRLYF